MLKMTTPPQALIITVILIALTAGIEALRCVQCLGITNYDPDNCFNPDLSRVIEHDCRKGEQCEQKLYHINYWVTQISRGCTANCNGRSYIYTDDFQIYCCNTDDCNSAITSSYSLMFSVVMLLTTVVVRRLLLQ